MPVTPITPAQIDEVGNGASASPSGHSRAEPSGLGPTAECPSRGPAASTGPIGWAWEYHCGGGEWSPTISDFRPSDASWRRNIRPLYDHPPAFAAANPSGGWKPELTGAHRLGRDRKGDVTINVPTALCWLQFHPEASTGTDEQTRPGVGFSLVAYPDSHGEWPNGVIPRDEAYKLYQMLGVFFDKYPPSVRDRSGEATETLGSVEDEGPADLSATPLATPPSPQDHPPSDPQMTVEEAREQPQYEYREFESQGEAWITRVEVQPKPSSNPAAVLREPGKGGRS